MGCAEHMVVRLWNGHDIICFDICVITPTISEHFKEVPRSRCENFFYAKVELHSVHHDRIKQLRSEMQSRTSVRGLEIEGYILSTYDDHQNEHTAPHDRRLHFLSGFTGSFGFAAVTLDKAALWTDNRYIYQADIELDCEWKIYKLDSRPTIAQWLSIHVPSGARVGANSREIPHFLWQEWDVVFQQKQVYFKRLNKNLIDYLWIDRPTPPVTSIRVYPEEYAGQNWTTKIEQLRKYLTEFKCDSIIVTSLTEIAYLLNLRGNELPYIPVFKAYLIVTLKEILLYTDLSKIDDKIKKHFRVHRCPHNECVFTKDYEYIWKDFRTYNQVWKRIFLPANFVYDAGASEAVYDAFPPDKIFVEISPVIFMKARKNAVERAGMKKAGIRDGAAMCDFLSYFEERYRFGETWTEEIAAREVNRSRLAQHNIHGLSMETTVAFGSHGALPQYRISNVTNTNISNDNTVIIESGGQYIDGTTIVSRTIHLGTPTYDQKKAYTAVLAGIIRMSSLVFPEDLEPAEIDILTRGPVWLTHNDYLHRTGHGVGAFLSVHESPVNIAYAKSQKYAFEEGYFLSSAPGFYKRGSFGIRLGNIVEVVDTKRLHPSTSRFFSFRSATFVPFEPKLIDHTLLSQQEKRWLNEYNAEIRQYIGEELKKQLKMNAFYWMMNKTAHVKEYLPKSEYDKNAGSSRYGYTNELLTNCILIFILLIRFVIYNGY